MSNKKTWAPAWAAIWAMPWPMAPTPTTPTLLNVDFMRELSSRAIQRDLLSASRFTMWVGVPWMKLTTLVNAALKYNS